MFIRQRTGLLVLALVALMAVGAAAGAADLVTPFQGSKSARPEASPAPQINGDRAEYTGWLRLFVVEPTSRYSMVGGKKYRFGFLDFALDSGIAIGDGVRQVLTVNWDAGTAGYSPATVTEDNIMIIGGIYNSERHEGYSYPPTGYPFEAYYVDAAAAATPGIAGRNDTSHGSTHTVLVEEGTATTCGYCPATANALTGIYDTDNYNFLYVAMIANVTNVNTEAYQRMWVKYNMAGTPTTYGDGGQSLVLGGYSTWAPYTDMLDLCASRPVPDVDLAVGLDYVATGQLQINVAMSNGTPAEALPELAGPPAGTDKAYTDSVYEFSASASDADGDNLYYMIDWGDNTSTGWMGPYGSSRSVQASHSWSEPGAYEVRFKSKDPWYETDWSDPLTVVATCCINRGNVDGIVGFAGPVDVSDLTFTVAYLFGGGTAPGCETQSNVDGIDGPGGPLDVSDLTFLVQFLFGEGPTPPPCD